MTSASSSSRSQCRVTSRRYRQRRRALKTCGLRQRSPRTRRLSSLTAAVLLSCLQRGQNRYILLRLGEQEKPVGAVHILAIIKLREESVDFLPPEVWIAMFNPSPFAH